MHSLLPALTHGVLAVVILMGVLWLVCRKIKNASWVDLGWVLSIMIMASTYFMDTAGVAWRKSAVLAMVLLWGLRLGSHLVARLMKEPLEDPRYLSMRQAWGQRADLYFLGFFMLQAIVAVVLSLPFLWVSVHRAAGIGWNEISAMVLWLIAFFGESIADRQLTRFKMDSKNKGRVCEIGLWRYSRHPNYFFECLIWVSFFLFAVSAPYGWTAVLSPALMIFFIVKGSGVPPAEAQSLRSRGEAYREYQKKTSMIIPWFRKGEA